MYPMHVVGLSSTCLLLLCGIFYSADAANFFGSDRNVFANRTQSAQLSWRYQIGGGEVFERLSCGFQRPGDIKFFVLVVKVSNNPGSVFSGSDFPSDYANRVRVQEATATLGFQILGVRNSDQRKYYCTLQYRSNNVLQNPLTSSGLTLSILDRPNFVNCLSPQLTTLSAVELGTFNLSCSVFGNPVPILTCNVRNSRGDSKEVYGGLPRNISLLSVTGVRRDYDHVICTADGRGAGTKTLQKKIIVFYVPSKPLNFRKTKTTLTTIEIAWSAPQLSGNKPLLNYIIKYGLNDNNLQIKNESANVLTSRLTGLQSRKNYIVTVQARNEIGVGQPERMTIETVDFTAPDSGKRSSDTTTIAIVVPIVVVLVLVIVVGVGCYLKKKKDNPKKYPTSYVEEAVDYPASGKSLYAKVDRNATKKTAEDMESTSGYPDILQRTYDGPGKTEMDYSPSKGEAAPYTPLAATNGSAYPNGSVHEDEEMSPSYEDSRKEYV